MTSRFLAWLTLAAIPAAFAQQHQHPSTSATQVTGKPTITSAAPAQEPGDRYVSAFADYRRFRLDEPLADWRGVNDELATMAGGGHAGHGRTTAGPQNPKPAPADHTQHGGKR